MMLKPGMYLQERYEILEQIGVGGMSEVYRAKCHKLNRIVAIKLLKEEFSEDANFVSKFKMEAQSAAGLSHPNIVSVYDVVDEGALHYIVMEIIEGITLKSYILKKGHLGARETIGIAIQVAQGIAAAHDQHIIHRDIKPQNMIISRDGKVKVADFGIARAVSSQTSSTAAVGTVHYISPEQARGGYSDARSDLYSLGITMYEMVTGRVPFDGETTVSIALSHLEDALIPPRTLNPDVPSSLERIILKCTKKKPEQRYADAYELIADLRRALVDPEDDKARQEAPEDTSSPTVIIDGEDLNTIQESARRSSPAVYETRSDIGREEKIREYKKKASGLLREGQGKTGKTGKRHSSEDVNPQIEKILTTVGIVAAFIIIVVVVVTIFARVGGGILNSGSGNKTGVESSPADETATAKEENTEAEASTETQAEALKLSELGLDVMTGKDAKALLEQHGLTVVLMPESSETVALDYVTRYEPAEAASETTVSVYVSTGPEVKTVKVPNITNATPEQAKGTLEALSLVLGLESQEKSETVPKGLIIRQSIIADSSIPAGTAVNYTVSTGKGTKYVAVVNDDYSLKDLFGPSSGDAQIKVQIVWKQTVNGQEVTASLLNPRMMGGDITIPVHFNITGADGVLTGEVQILDLTYGRVLKTYPLEFVEVSE